VEAGVVDSARERRLVARIVAGDETALGVVYDGWSSYVYTLALRVCRDRVLAEDVTQEVFVHLWQRADAFDPARASLRTWLGMLTHRRAVDRVRREEARRLREARDHQRGQTTAAGVEEVAVQTLTSERVRQAMAALPPDQRSCIVLAYFEGKTFREVATTLGIPEGTAKSRIRLGLAKLADLLDGMVSPA
jgi:RNA polymerase sigma-70 factor (ECF subfamily)